MADLGKVLKDLRHNLTLEEKVRIALKVAKGMEELHRAGILHCDLKCKNILVRRTPTVRTAPRRTRQHRNAVPCRYSRRTRGRSS
jgi:serine/threonine protein kinase